jgi:hypothetical protein
MFVVNVTLILHIPIRYAGIFVGDFGDFINVLFEVLLAHVFENIGKVEEIKFLFFKSR